MASDSENITMPAAALADSNKSERALHFSIFAGLVVAIAIGPFVLYPVFLMKVLCFGLFALAFHLLLGYGGLLSLGHAAYFGMAGYTCAYSAKVWGLTPELAILCGTSLSALLGFILGTLAIRRQGIYFAMITLALAQMIYFFCLQAKFTGGEDGIQSVPRGKLFGVIDISSDLSLYILIAFIFLAGFLAIYRIIHSPFGQVLKAIRDNEPRMISLGYRVGWYKQLVFMLSASFAGLAGSTKVLVFQLASLSDVHFTMSGEVVLMTLLGGIGTVFGPIAGAFMIAGMETYLSQFGVPVTIIQGCVFVVCVMLFREGLAGWLSRRLKVSL